jgi:hypothetical protein
MTWTSAGWFLDGDAFESTGTTMPWTFYPIFPPALGAWTAEGAVRPRAEEIRLLTPNTGKDPILR